MKILNIGSLNITIHILLNISSGRAKRWLRAHARSIAEERV